MIQPLSRAYPSREGVPVLTQVDTQIFERTYFTFCMSCTFCRDWCCSFGADVDVRHVQRILPFAEELEVYTGVGRERWFASETTTDDELPGGAYTETRVENGACVFLDREQRGCKIHRFCLEQGIDYHQIKPMVCCLFPVTFGQGLLCPSDDVEDESLVCLGTGPTLYRGARAELEYYFGRELIEELDAVESKSRVSLRVQVSA